MTDDALRLYTYDDLAAAWGVTRDTVRRWIAADRQAGHRVVMYRRRKDRLRWVALVRGDSARAVMARHHEAIPHGAGPVGD